MSKKKKEMRLRMCEVVLYKESTSDLKGIFENIENLYKKGWIAEYAYIKHDKDVYVRGDEVPEDKELGDKKRDHYHIGLQFPNQRGLSVIAEKLGVEENYIEKIKSPRFTSFLEYLTHRNAKNKYQYTDEEVITSIVDWQDGRNKETIARRAKEFNAHVDWYLMEAAKGRITLSDFKNGNLPMTGYIKNKSKFDTAFKVYSEERMREINYSGEFEKKVLYITGKSGTGKTTLAKELMLKLVGGNEDDIYVASGTNDMFDSYKGERGVIIDDVRGEDFDYTSFLKLTDNHNATSFNSRYQNKDIVAEYIMLTSVDGVYKFAKEMDTDGSEESKQVYRRVKQYYILNHDGQIYTYSYDDETGRYIEGPTKENKVMKRMLEKSGKEVDGRIDSDILDEI